MTELYVGDIVKHYTPGMMRELAECLGNGMIEVHLKAALEQAANDSEKLVSLQNDFDKLEKAWLEGKDSWYDEDDED